MEKFQPELEKVAEMFNTNRIPVKGNEHRLTKVAFDLFRVDGDETDDLWQVQADDDGNEFLVRTFFSNDEKTAEASDWSVKADKKCANLTISFRDVPLTRLACKDYGAENYSDGKSLQGVVFNKLCSDGEFALKLVSSLPKEKLFALKQAGLIEDIKNWLESKDITDAVINKVEEIMKEDKKDEENNEEEQDAKGPAFKAYVPFGDLSAEDQWSLAFLEMKLEKKANS